MELTVAVVLLAVLGTADAASLLGDDIQLENVEHFSPFGSLLRCLSSSMKGYQVEVFGVLPGHGWDNLRNVDEGQVIAFNYSLCRMTDDGRYLLPDSISAVPVKTSRVVASDEFIEHWKKWQSSTAKSINIDAAFGLLGINISGKFSAEFEDIKTKQISEKSTTIRTQLRYARYDVHLQPDAPLHPRFKLRVMDIAAAHQLKQQDRARYLSELLVRDFGTHVVTKASAGGALIQMDQVQEDWVRDQFAQNKTSISAAALTAFSLSFKISGGYKVVSSFEESYKAKLTSSEVLTLGGPIYMPSNFSSTDWAADLNANLVAIDRSGDPLHYVITERSFPELPASTLQQVIDSVHTAAENYYLFNRNPGCLDTKSPNFDPGANTDDGMCQPSATNLTFGGVFQTCTMRIRNNGDLCSQLTQTNPLTGNYSCPPSYSAVKLSSGSTTSSRLEPKCSGVWVFKSCEDVNYESTADYEAYWCVATGSVPKDSGVLFGGLFTPRIYNPLTQTPECPSAYFPLRIGDQGDLHICISNDNELGTENSLPFGGFISCKAGNPLAVTDRASSQTESKDLEAFLQDNPLAVTDRASSQTESKDLGAFLQDQPSEWPKRCPDGYSRHLATIDQGCQINYCVAAGSLLGPALPPIKRPPFVPTPPLLPLPADNLVIFDPKSHTWLWGEAAHEELDHFSSHNSSRLFSGAVNKSLRLSSGAVNNSSQLSAGAVAGISVATILAVVALIAVAVVVGKRPYNAYSRMVATAGAV